LIIDKLPLISVTSEAGVLSVNINERMNSALHNEFINACMPLTSATTTVVVNMQNCPYIDSFGLGALIILIDACKDKNIDLSLVKVASNLKNILLLAEFDKLIKISYL
jgi:anti-anti-sigma factor